MGLPCGQICFKLVLFVFNFIIFILGGVLLGVGIWIISDPHFIIKIFTVLEEADVESAINTPELIKHAAYIFVGCGGVLFILGFLGCCGAVCESRLLLSIYGLLLLLVLIIQITAVSLVFAYEDEAERQLKEALKYSIEKYYTTPEKANSMTLFWNLVMVETSCCGIEDHNDFDSATLWHDHKDRNQEIPAACCKKDEDCIRSPDKYNSNMNTGCYGTILDWVKDNSAILIIVGLSVAVVELAAIIFSFCLCHAIGSSAF